MIITTIQPQEVYNICKEKPFYTDITRSEYYDWKEFIEAYNWLSSVMKTKIKKPFQAQYPIWGWYRYNGKYKLDLRQHTHLYPPNYYAITLDIPDDQVLLSDYESWHAVLNKFVLHDLDDEENFDKNDDYYDKLKESDPNKYNEIMVQSWYHIFDLKPNVFSSGTEIQATFWKIDPKWIIKAKKFGSMKESKNDD